MRSLSELILDFLENDERKKELKNSSAGEMWYDPGAEKGGDTKSVSELNQLHNNRANRIREQFKDKFGQRSLQYFASTLLLVLGISLFFTMIGEPVRVQVIGLSLSIVGSIILGLSLLRGPHAVIMETSGKVPTVDGSNQDAETLEYVRSTIDGVNGIFYIILGFLVQIIGVIWQTGV